MYLGGSRVSSSSAILNRNIKNDKQIGGMSGWI